MKNSLIIFLLLFSVNLFAQKSDTLMTYNLNGLPTKKINKATSVYKVFKKDSATWIRTTSDKNLVPILKETFSDSSLTILNGGYLSYKNGKPYLKGFYTDNQKAGNWIKYDSIPRAIETETYSNGLLHGPYISYWPNASVFEQANYIDNKLVGERKIFYENGNLAVKEIYDDKSGLTDTTYLDIDGRQTTMNQLIVLPNFPGGMTKLYSFIAKNLRYPALARDANAQGRVFLSFIVNEDGDLEDIELTRSPNQYLGEEAIRVVKTFPKWTPGTLLKRPLRIKYNINVNFTLSGPGY